MHYGIQKTTMQDIAQDAGMAVGTLYLYFRNKEELVLAIAEQCRVQQSEHAEEILKSSLSSEDKIRQFLLEKFQCVREYRESHPHAKEFVKLMIELDSDCSRLWRERFEMNLQGLLESGKADGTFHIKDCADEAKVLFLSISGFYPLPYLDLPEWPREEELHLVIDWFIRTWKTVRHEVHA